ncbi:putative membrane protein [Sphingobium fontiphilum]|uniref:Putative membrane protein n=1 Tax=Sphingobium fontiphilum TaxID=944425 RepID=A0A7W6DCU8_9SPHN|nr:NnrU family protein [Sphingobium fontiphilum]MBB3980377.1 putative membrane protein [Sphingobium fontiphilum]
MTMVLIAAIAFVGSHFILSHPLRAPLVARVGEKGFLGLYSLVAAATLIWLAMAYRTAPAQAPLWVAGDGLWAIATAIMLLASFLFMGSLVGNPAVPDPEGKMAIPAVAKGVYAITRHPMMWGFALWGVAHIIAFPEPSNIILCGAIMLLALGGAAMQDRKKERLKPAEWAQWEAKTSYWPFAAIAAGRARIGGFGMHTLAGGLVLWLAASWAHLPLAGWAAGIWRWIG